MESANHQLRQDQLVGSPSSSSSSLPTPSSCYGVASSSTQNAWTPIPNVTLSSGNFIYNGVILNSTHKNEILLPPAANSSMIQESAGLHWINSQSAHEHFAKIKDEFSDSFPKFTEMSSSPSSNINEDSDLSTASYLKNEQKNLNDLGDKLLLKGAMSSGFPINGNHFPAGDLYSSAHNISSVGGAMPSRGNFSQIYPSINISNLSQISSTNSTNFDMNLQFLDLLASSRVSGDFSQPSHDNLGLYKESLPFGCDQHHLQQSSRRPSCSPSNKATKRHGGVMEPKATQFASKKSRLESRASCPPMKVRKEKLGDRIAALQQLVAPFGKTDTASVLLEAIGYIKFLQNQVETLSVPYMKSSRSRPSRTMQGGSIAANGDEEPKRDLRSRGLCLVPLSCMSYVTNDDCGGGIWPPPSFGGGT
ncbi:hypothetical protein CICLE_v10001291mg [Citrus x clementina]|uniref:BHLH domain-containing protein n=1 Tax=Citrus clementina TaxID=85681 RepID=V4T9W8_CITCL|nr:hypothetical protein CICLE_v10001291mg [Citrus x clementina]